MDTKPSLKILTWNANGVTLKILELTQFVEDNHIDVICLQETYLSPSKTLFLPGYVVYRLDRSTQGGGVAIAIKSSIRHRQADISDFLGEAVGLEITPESGKPTRIFSVYVPPTVNIKNLHLTSLFQPGCEVILAGDFNSKHEAWNCLRTNPNGRRLQRLSINHDFAIEPPDSPNHFPHARNQSPDILSLFLCYGLTQAVEVSSTPELSSDHNPTILTKSGNFIAREVSIRAMDWTKLCFLLEESEISCSVIRTPRELDSEVLKLMDDITSKMNQATIYKEPTQFPKNLPPDAVKLLRRKNKARRRWQRTRDPAAKHHLNYLQRQLKTRLSEIRSNSFDEFLGEAEAHPKRVWKVIKSIRGSKHRVQHLHYEGRNAYTHRDIAETFASCLSEQCTPNPSALPHQEFHRVVTQFSSNPELDPNPISPATVAEIKTIISGLKNKKAPGPDGIPNAVIKILPRKHLAMLTNIVNAMMRLQHFPAPWKNAVVVCIPKAGKPVDNPSSYRPISLLSTLSKVAEEVIRARLEDHVQQNNLIPNFQFGFRKEHGTGHQLLRVTEHIVHARNQRRQVSMLLLDVRQAFDRVWHDGLIYKMQPRFPPYLTNLVRSYLSGRTFQVRVQKDLSNPKPILSGVPQGSKISPILFNLYCCDFPTDPKVLIAAYADDVALISHTPQYQYSSNYIQRFLPEVLDWYSKWRLEINASKSVAIFISDKRRPPPKIHINDHYIEWSPEAKYLGVIIDRKLSWSPQIKAVRNKILAAYNSLKSFFKCKKISHPTKLRAFNAIIHSISTYAIPIWGTAESLPRLQGTYMRLLRNSLGIPYYVRNSQIRRELQITTLAESAKIHARNLRESVLTHSNPEISGLVNYRPRNYPDRYKRPSLLAD